MKVAIVGSRSYQKGSKIQDFIYKLKQKFGDDLTIISGGAKDGADSYAKKYALVHEIRYKEYNPAHTQRNLYSAMPSNYYGKPFHVSNYHHRNMLIARSCDILVAFCSETELTEGTSSVVKQATRKNKKVLIIK